MAGLDGQVSDADTAAAGCPLQEPVAWSASTGGVQPEPVRPGKLALEAVAELGAHVGHGWPLER